MTVSCFGSLPDLIEKHRQDGLSDRNDDAPTQSVFRHSNCRVCDWQYLPVANSSYIYSNNYALLYCIMHRAWYTDRGTQHMARIT